MLYMQILVCIMHQRRLYADTIEAVCISFMYCMQKIGEYLIFRTSSQISNYSKQTMHIKQLKIVYNIYISTCFSLGAPCPVNPKYKRLQVPAQNSWSYNYKILKY